MAGNASLWRSGTLTASSYFGTSGFNALPAGGVWGGGTFGESTGFWSSTGGDEGLRARKITYDASNMVMQFTSKSVGFSVRCVRDN